jgi:serine/threonine protein kinase
MINDVSATLLDFTPSNILLRIIGLDGLSEEKVLQEVGEPIQVKVTIDTGECPTKSSAPKYLIRSIDFDKVRRELVTNEAYIIDPGESFRVLDPPEELGIPEIYRSPELLLDKTARLGSDLWAHGCTLFEIRTGRKPFNTMDVDADDVLYNIVVLGRLPEPWWTAWKVVKHALKMKASLLGAP